MDVIAALLLAGPAGLKSYLTLALIALAAQHHAFEPQGFWGDLLTKPLSVAVLILLAAYEVIVDKIPGVDSINNLVGTLVRPITGGLLMVVNPNPLGEESPLLAFPVGFLTAGGIHALKTAFRPILAVGSLGLGTPFVSTAEDAIVIAMVLLGTG